MQCLVTAWSYLGKYINVVKWQLRTEQGKYDKRSKWFWEDLILFKCEHLNRQQGLSNSFPIKWLAVWLMRDSSDTYFPTIIWIWCWTSARTLAVMLLASWSVELWKLSIICWSWPTIGSLVSCSLCFLFFMWVSSCWMSTKIKVNRKKYQFSPSH